MFIPNNSGKSRYPALAILLLAVLLAGGCSDTTRLKSDPADTELGQPKQSPVRKIAAAHASIILQGAPEWATQMGATTDTVGMEFRDRLADFSPQANEAAGEQLKQMLADIRAIDRSRLTGSDATTYDVMLFSYEMAERQNRFRIGHPSFLSASPPYAVNQLFGPQIDIPRLLIAQHPIRSKQDARHWLGRLAQIPRVLNELADMTEADAQKDVVPPYFALQAIAASAKSFTDNAVASHPIATSFKTQLDAIEGLDASDRDALYEQALKLLEAGVYPAYRNFGSRMTALVASAGRDAGLWRLNDGAAMYQVALEAWGANGLSADEIHQIGLDDVARIHGEMDSILMSVGYLDGTVGGRMARLAKDPTYLIADNDEAKAKLVASLQANVETVLERAPNWFTDIPDYEVEVRRIPLHEQDSSASGYYTPPPIDGSRPGIFWINMKNPADFPTYTLKSLLFHEAVPGHHFQAARSLSITDLPLLQNMMWFGDYGEGWGLYAEELAKEMGLYENDPLGDLGRYRMELYRAARLVVDTGLHHKRWSREQAIDYMVDVTGESRESITREIDRYAVWPGQAASYKLGMIQFQRLRKRAEEELGTAFDIREFHAVLLRDGAMPMAALAIRVDEWIDSKTGMQ